MTRLLLLLVLMGVAGASVADDTSNEQAALYQSFFRTETKHCTVTAATEPRWHLIRVDISRKEAQRRCALEKPETIELFTAIFKTHHATKDRQTYQSLMIGSVGNYTWMTEFLTDTSRVDPAWSRETGKPARGSVNAYVNRVLSRPPVVDVFNQAGKENGYVLSDMDCEKVFLSDEGLPMDAFCWLTLEQN